MKLGTMQTRYITGVIKGTENGGRGLMWIEVCDVTVDTSEPQLMESYPVCESGSMNFALGSIWDIEINESN